MYYDLLVVVVLVFLIVTFSLVQVLLNDILSEITVKITSKSKGTFFSNDWIFPLKIILLSSHHISVISITCNSS